jgi:hypothetical protein
LLKILLDSADNMDKSAQVIPTFTFIPAYRATRDTMPGSRPISTTAERIETRKKAVSIFFETAF